MPLPSAYTEGALLDYMGSVIGPHLAGLRLDANEQLQEALNDVLGILGTPLASLTTTADLMKVRAIARWQAWVAATDAASEKFPLKAGTSSLEQSKIFDQIERRLAEAAQAARRYPEAALVLGGAPRRPVVGQIATTAPATPLYPPDPNSPIYSGRPAGWWP